MSHTLRVRFRRSYACFEADQSAAHAMELIG
jgi:hypothetical protein